MFAQDTYIDWDHEGFLSQIDVDDLEDFHLTDIQEFRFAPPVDTSEVEAVQRSRIPLTTVKSTKWGVTAWHSWQAQRNKKSKYVPSEAYHLVPALTETLDAKELNFWLCK